MSTKDQIVQIGDALIRDKGINAFSFSDISHELGIKSASVHYHFATKTDLVMAIIDEHIRKVKVLQQKTADKDPVAKLKAFISIYTVTKAENRVCLVGSLATDLNTVEKKIRLKLSELANCILNWVTDILAEGKAARVFHFDMKARDKAMLLVSIMLASLQFTRLTRKADFTTIKESIIKELTS